MMDAWLFTDTNNNHFRLSFRFYFSYSKRRLISMKAIPFLSSTQISQSLNEKKPLRFHWKIAEHKLVWTVRIVICVGTESESFSPSTNLQTVDVHFRRHNYTDTTVLVSVVQFFRCVSEFCQCRSVHLADCSILSIDETWQSSSKISLLLNGDSVESSKHNIPITKCCQQFSVFPKSTRTSTSGACTNKALSEFSTLNIAASRSVSENWIDMSESFRTIVLFEDFHDFHGKYNHTSRFTECISCAVIKWTI